jgi:DNA sulfur modification protein DndD
MIFERLVLHNFGAYHGEHVIDFSVTKDKPVVLVGALNGSGKTTLLEATQLALFGRAVRGTSRAKMGYSDYLLQLINRNVRPEVGASVSLTFSHRHAGHDDLFTISRTWRKAGTAMKEEQEVLRNGAVDVQATARWLEFVEDFLPAQLADLFLFDGERIEALADPDRSAEFLKAGVHALLGLDLVDHLTRSLTVLERRKRGAQTVSKQPREAVERCEAELETLLRRRTALTEERATAQNMIDSSEKALRKLQQQLVKEGGTLYQERERIAEQAAQAVRECDERAEELRETAAGDAPLLLVPELIEAARDMAQRAGESTIAARILAVLADRDEQLSRKLAATKVPLTVRKELHRFLEETRAPWLQAKAAQLPFEVKLTGFDHLTMEARDRLCEETAARLQAYEDARATKDAAQSRQAAVPSKESLKALLDGVQAAEHAMTHARAKGELLDEQLGTLAAQIERQEAAVERAREELLKVELNDAVDARVVQHSCRARGTLFRFRQAVAAKNLARLEFLITERFQDLLRKGACLVERVCIDPESFELRLRDREGRILDPLTLSAGERQLLAVAIVWALAKASGRTLPTMIDTPLGRLDGKHRSKLVESYFPAASHQVVLLSTDEEINGTYYAQLKSRIAREYLITFDAVSRSSQIEPGYFLQNERAVA